jgi:UDP-N-acetylmuramate: L-alanyl-gamma-D-glutamyl-meso-diaminopimelate ligase
MVSGVSKIHFIGICGTAMASVAVALKDQGYAISGSDSNVYPPMSTFLQERGVSLMSGYKPENLSGNPDLIIVGNAISRGNAELEAVLEKKLRYLSLPETLKEFFLWGKRNVVVSGTHGKTTTTSLITWILEAAGKQPSYMIGGIPKNLGQGGCFRKSEFVVLEGDEYDTAFFDKRSKFLHYLPEVAVINNLEFDHADIFENLDAIKLTFRRFVNIIPKNGLIVANGDDANVRDVVKNSLAPVKFVGCGGQGIDVRICDAKFSDSGAKFSIGGLPFELQLTGMFNVRNAAVAITVAQHLGIPDPVIQRALATFEGVKRRQEVREVVKGITIIDDFGHHPTAIRETLEALRKKYQGARLWAFFEPRSNTTRRAVFQNELPNALSLADGVFVSQVAKLEQLPPDNRLNPEKVMSDIRSHGREAHYLPSVQEIVDVAKTKLKSGDVAVIFSNGSFDGIHEKLIGALKNA